MADIIKYIEEPNDTNLYVIDATDGSKPSPQFKVIYGNERSITTLEFNWDTFDKGIKTIIYYEKRESLLIEAVRNFVRKVNFAELNEKFDDEEISEDFYYKELQDNNDKYAVTLKNIHSPQDVIHITDLVHRVGFDLRDFSASEISEMFSVKENQLISYINNITSLLR